MYNSSILGVAQAYSIFLAEFNSFCNMLVVRLFIQVDYFISFP